MRGWLIEQETAEQLAVSSSGVVNLLGLATQNDQSGRYATPFLRVNVPGVETPG